MIPWFEEAFRADYLDVYAHRDDAAAVREVEGALALLGHDRAGRLLDLAAGAGRHAEAFTAAGCRVFCLDLSADLAARSAARGLRSVRADMRSLPFLAESFTSVACLFSSFGYFEEDREHRETLQEIARVLQPEGAVLLDLMDRETVRARLVPHDTQQVAAGVLDSRRRLVKDGARVEKHLQLKRHDGSVRQWRESVRLFTSAELEALAGAAGLVLHEVAGEYDGRAYRSGETRQLVVMRKP